MKRALVASSSMHSTRKAGKDRDGLAAIVLNGVPGTPMPPWDIEISAAEAAWLVARLQQGIVP